MAAAGEMDVRVGAGGLLTVTAVLRAEATPADVAQILILCAAVYCIAV